MGGTLRVEFSGRDTRAADTEDARALLAKEAADLREALEAKESEMVIAILADKSAAEVGEMRVAYKLATSRELLADVQKYTRGDFRAFLGKLVPTGLAPRTARRITG